MDQEVWLQPMTAEMYHAYFKEYQNDPDLYLDPGAYTVYTYDVQTWSGTLNGRWI